MSTTQSPLWKKEKSRGAVQVHASTPLHNLCRQRWRLSRTFGEVWVPLAWYSSSYFPLKAQPQGHLLGLQKHLHFKELAKNSQGSGGNCISTFLMCSLRMLLKTGTFLTHSASLHICLFPFPLLPTFSRPENTLYQIWSTVCLHVCHTVLLEYYNTDSKPKLEQFILKSRKCCDEFLGISCYCIFVMVLNNFFMCQRIKTKWTTNHQAVDWHQAVDHLGQRKQRKNGVVWIYMYFSFGLPGISIQKMLLLVWSAGTSNWGASQVTFVWSDLNVCFWALMLLIGEKIEGRWVESEV